MYTPEHFSENDIEAQLQLIRSAPFATLITADVEASPQVTHIPLVIEGDGPDWRLIGHMARANPHWQAFGTDAFSTAIFHGPHAYVSPIWYDDPNRSVPTWNYAVVHVMGRPQVVGEDRAREILQISTSLFQASLLQEGVGEAWGMDDARQFVAGRLQAIVAFELVPEQVQGKFKLSQNRSDADRARVIDRLAALDDVESHATAALMRERGLSS
jgi:transcriptional regulator